MVTAELVKIPEGWSQTNLQKITTEIGDGIHSTPKYVKQSQIFFINGNNLIQDFIKILDNTKRIDELEFKKHQKNINENTLLLSINGTIGNLAFYKNEKVVLGKSIAYINLQKNINQKFVFYFLKSNFVKNFIHDELTGSTIKNLSLGTIRKIPIILPNDDKEQQKIVQILSDTNELVKQLDYLITKKKNIKRGTMQELLTGKRRLEGFSEEWEVKTLEEITNCMDNLRIPLNNAQRLKMNGNIPYCGANGVLDFVNDYVIDDDFILIAEDGGHFNEYQSRPIAYKMSGKCWVNNHAHILKSKEGFNQDFIFYSLVHKNIKRFLVGGTRSKLNKSEMYRIEINIPTDIEEQIRITNIISDMDSEIEQLETKRDKYVMIKNGMMQKLLTGEIRLT
jgi:type I restriction enzyme, S subunit